MPKMQYKVKGETFEVDDRYEVKKKIGAGAYGLLCAATDKKDHESQVAVKKIKDAFEDAIDCKRTLREVRLLQHFTHENILNLRDIMLPPAGSIDQWKDIYLVLELMDTDLHYIIHSKQALTDDHIQYFIYQILRGLKAIHSASVRRIRVTVRVTVSPRCEAYQLRRENQMTRRRAAAPARRHQLLRRAAARMPSRHHRQTAYLYPSPSLLPSARAPHRPPRYCADRN